MNITIILLLLAFIGFLYLLKIKSAKRKENLNIVKEGDRLHLFLSDDYFFSVKLEQDRIDSATSKKLSSEVKEIKRSIRKISFINFRDDTLRKRLNKVLRG